jgi:thermitase
MGCIPWSLWPTKLDGWNQFEKRMRLALLLLILMAITSSIAWADDDDDDYDGNEYVVKLEAATGATIEEINANYGTVTLKALIRSSGIYLVRVPDTPPPIGDDDDWGEVLEDDPRIQYAEPNIEHEIPEGGGNYTWSWGGPDFPPQDSQYAWSLLDIAGAHNLSRGAGVTVAVLDTGVQFTHPALANRLTSARYNFVEDNAIPNDIGNGLDDDGDGLIDEAVGHGTHIAGIIAMVAPEAQIMPIRVLNSDGRGDIFRVAEGILFAVESGADVINLSLGSPRESDLLEDIIEEMIEDYGVVFVAAAGNENSSRPYFPAEEDDVIGVSAVNEFRRKAEFAAYGDWIDVVAPGENIYSAFPVDGYAYWSGTSMATPFVTGQVALMRSLSPRLSPERILLIIRATGQSVDAENPAYANQLGRGLIDISAALMAQCEQYFCSNTTPENPGDEPLPDGEMPIRIFVPSLLR